MSPTRDEERFLFYHCRLRDGYGFGPKPLCWIGGEKNNQKLYWHLLAHACVCIEQPVARKRTSKNLFRCQIFMCVFVYWIGYIVFILAV